MSSEKIKTYKHRKFDASKKFWLRAGEVLFVIFVASIIVFRFLIGISFVKGNSMYPTLESGEMVVYSRVESDYEVGDIVSVRMPSGEYYVKRIVAVGGDTVELIDGKIYVNGEAQEYGYGTTEAEDDYVVYPYEVEEGKYFVVGDNREESLDSRSFGAVLKNKIQGRVLFVSE